MVLELDSSFEGVFLFGGGWCKGMDFQTDMVGSMVDVTGVLFWGYREWRHYTRLFKSLCTFF